MSLSTADKLALGGAAAALVAAVIISTTSAKSQTVATGLPVGTYTKLPPGSTLQQGGTYLLSRTIPAGSGSTDTLASAVQEMKAAGVTVLGAWDVGATPPGWPSGDPNAATGVHVVVKNTASTSIPTGSDVSIWSVT